MFINGLSGSSSVFHPKSSIEQANAKVILTLSDNQEIYDAVYGGFSGLVTTVDKNQGGFILDTPDTEGVKVDE
ncbi:MAG: hypothetical protein Q4A55_03115 [Aerococcus sp.]|nr:hypothetical protein [Aerococcus sp.]